jgi:hypothetical protein
LESSLDHVMISAFGQLVELEFAGGN